MMPGDRVRYVGDVTFLPYDATVEWLRNGKVALRLRNGILFVADPADVREVPDGALS